MIFRSALNILSALVASVAVFALTAPMTASASSYLVLGDTPAAPGILGTMGSNAAISVSVYPELSFSTFLSATQPIAVGGSYGTTYSYDYTFTLASNTPAVRGYGIWQNLSDVNAKLVADTQTQSGYTIGLSAIPYSSINTAPDSSQVSTITWSGLAPGTYTFELSGALQTGSSIGSFTGGIVSAVPLPGALPLFGGALMGLAAFARRRIKKAA